MDYGTSIIYFYLVVIRKGCEIEGLNMIQTPYLCLLTKKYQTHFSVHVRHQLYS